MKLARSRGRGRKVPLSVAVYGDIKPKEVDYVGLNSYRKPLDKVLDLWYNNKHEE